MTAPTSPHAGEILRLYAQWKRTKALADDPLSSPSDEDLEAYTAQMVALEEQMILLPASTSQEWAVKVLCWGLIGARLLEPQTMAWARNHVVALIEEAEVAIAAEGLPEPAEAEAGDA